MRPDANAADQSGLQAIIHPALASLIISSVNSMAQLQQVVLSFEFGNEIALALEHF